MYKITQYIIAIPISDFLNPLVRPSRHYHPLSQRLITATTDYYNFSFFPRAVFQWNNLPLETVACSKKNSTKKRKNSSCATQLIDRHSNVSNLTCMFSNFRTHYSVFISTELFQFRVCNSYIYEIGKLSVPLHYGLWNIEVFYNSTLDLMLFGFEDI